MRNAPLDRSGSIRLILPLLLAAAGSLGAQTAGFRLEPSTSAVAPGEAVTVEVYLDDPALAPIGGVQLALLFDTAVFELTAFEEPGEIPGAVEPDLFLWNGPPPFGGGGPFGCATWWDSFGDDAISALLTFPGDGFSAATGLLFRFELTALPGAPLGAGGISHALPDASCLWSGSVIVDPDGQFMPTGAPDLPLPVTNVPPVVDLACGSAGGDALLGWSLGGSYSAIRIRRDGVLLPALAGSATSWTDTSVVPGAVHEYSVSGVAGGLESPSSACTVSVTTGISPPVGLVCTDLGGAALIEWLNPPIGWLTIEVLRNGAVIVSIVGSSTSYTDAGAPIGVPVAYAVRGILDFAVGQTSPACTVTVSTAGSSFLRGDSNGDGGVNIADASTTLSYLFQSGSIPCADAADANDSGALDIADAIYALAYLFTAGPPPPPPHPVPGTDPTADPLDCAG
jgi:hypothetical protein